MCFLHEKTCKFVLHLCDSYLKSFKDVDHMSRRLECLNM